MKKLLDKWISISLIKRIIGGLALGIILGLLVPKASGIALFGSVFVGALKAIAPLLVFVLVISSFCHSGKSHGGVIKTGNNLPEIESAGFTVEFSPNEVIHIQTQPFNHFGH